MSLFTIAKKMLKLNPIKNLMFIVTEFFSTALMFILFNMMSNPLYQGLGVSNVITEAVNDITGETIMADVGNYFIIITLFATVYAIIMNFYVSQLYFSTNYRDFSNLMLSGYSPWQIGKLCFLEFAILAFPPIALADILCRFIFIPGFDAFVFKTFNIVGTVGTVYQQSLYLTYGFILVIICMVVIVHYNNMVIIDINSLRERSADIGMRIVNKIHNNIILAILPVIFYVGGIYLAYFSQNIYHSDYSTITATIGCIGLIYFTVPYFIGIIKKVKPNYYNVVILSEIMTDLQDSGISVILLFFSSVFSITFLTSVTEVSPASFYTTSFSLLCLVVMVSILIFVKFFIRIETKCRSLASIRLIGYRMKDIHKIVTREVIGFYMILILIPCIHSAAVTLRAIGDGYLTTTYALVILMIYVAPLLLSMIVTLILHHYTIRNEVH